MTLPEIYRAREIDDELVANEFCQYHLEEVKKERESVNNLLKKISKRSREVRGLLYDYARKVGIEGKQVFDACNWLVDLENDIELVIRGEKEK